MIRVTISTSKVFGPEKSARLVQAALDRMNFMLDKLRDKIVEEKLSGQVLNSDSGKLASSIAPIPAAISGTKITGGIKAAGGSAWYGKIHEYGAVLMAHRKIVTKSTLAESWQVTFPERSFVRSSIREMRSEIVNSIREAVIGEMRNK